MDTYHSYSTSETKMHTIVITVLILPLHERRGGACKQALRPLSADEENMEAEEDRGARQIYRNGGAGDSAVRSGPDSSSERDDEEEGEEEEGDGEQSAVARQNGIASSSGRVAGVPRSPSLQMISISDTQLYSIIKTLL